MTNKLIDCRSVDDGSADGLTGSLVNDIGKFNKKINQNKTIPFLV